MKFYPSNIYSSANSIFRFTSSNQRFNEGISFRNLHSYVSNPFSRVLHSVNPLNLKLRPFSNATAPLFSGLILPFFLYKNQDQAVAFCAPKEANTLPQEAYEESHFHGIRRHELKEKSPSLFEYFYTEDFEKRKKASLNRLSPEIKANAFSELLDMGQEAVDKVRGKDISIVIGEAGAGKSTFITWLSGRELERKQNEWGEYYYELSPKDEASAPTRISHKTSGTSLPVVVEAAKGHILVDMPGMKDTRVEMITVANSILLEKLINTAASTSFILTVSLSKIDVDRGTSWVRDFNLIIDSLGISEEEAKDFQLGSKGSSNSPLMILVNNTRSETLIDIDLRGFKEKAADTINENADDENPKVGHLVNVYSPSMSSRADVLDQIDSLKKTSHDVKILPTDGQFCMCLQDLGKLRSVIEKSLEFSRTANSLENLKRDLEKVFIPSFRYCDAISEFAQWEVFEKNQMVKKKFGKELLSFLKEKLKEAMENKNQQQIDEVGSIYKLVTEKVDPSPEFIRESLTFLVPDIVEKINPHAAGLLTAGGTAILSAQLGVASLGAVFAATATVTGGFGFHTLKLDQVVVDSIRKIGGDKIPFYKEIFYKKDKLTRLSSSYKKMLENISNQAKKSLEIRDRKRPRVKDLVVEINKILKRGEYPNLVSENEKFIRNEKSLFETKTNDLLKFISKEDDLDKKKKIQAPYKQNYKETFQFIEKLSLMSKKDFSNLDITDQSEILSKIKSLKVRLNKLHSVHKKYLEKEEISRWAQLQEPRIDRFQPSLTEMGLNKVIEVTDNFNFEESLFKGLSHLIQEYGPEENIFHNLQRFLEIRKLEARIENSKSPVETSLGDLEALKDRLKESIGKIPEACSLEEYKKYLVDVINPIIKTAEQASDITSKIPMENYLEVRKSFEEQLAGRLTEWIDNVSEGKLDPHELNDFLSKIPGEIATSPHLVGPIIEELRIKVVTKVNPHIAGFLTTVVMGLVAFSTTGWISIPLAIIGGLYLNGQKIDQKALQMLSEKTKRDFPMIDRWVHEKSPSEALANLYEIMLESISSSAKEFLEVRDHQRSRVKNLLVEVNQILKKGNKYGFLIRDNETFINEEELLFEKETNYLGTSLSSGSDNNFENSLKNDYKNTYKNLFKFVEIQLLMSKKDFSHLNDTDQKEILSKIKSLKERLKKLHSVQKNYIENEEISRWAQFQELGIDRFQPSWTEMGWNKVKGAVDNIIPEGLKGYVFP